MPSEIDSILRSPKAYALARKALDAMETHRVWPTALNFELWMHYVAAKDSDVAVKIDSLIRAGSAFTDQVGEQIAAEYLPASTAPSNPPVRPARPMASNWPPPARPWSSRTPTPCAPWSRP